MTVILCVRIDSHTSITSFYTLEYTHPLYLTFLKMATLLAETYRMSLCIYKLISVYLCAFFGSMIVYINIYCLMNFCPQEIQHVRYVVNKVPIGQVSLQALRFSLEIPLTSYGTDIKSVV
jgi:hypothetical protein